MYDTQGWDIIELHKYLMLRLNLFLLLKAPAEHQLEDNLKNIYIYFLIAKILDMKISSKQATHFVADMLGYKDYNVIYNYKTALRRKGFFVKKGSDRDYHPIQAFNFDKNTINKTVSYSFNIAYVKKHSYDAITSKGKPIIYENN